MRVRNGVIALVLTAALGVTVAGCGSAGADGKGGPPSSDRPRSSSPASPSAGQDRKKPSPVLVDMVVSGGFAGRHQQVRVHEDGTYTTLDKKKDGPKGELDTEKLGALRQALDSADFDKLPRRTVDEDGRDMLVYVVVYDHVTVMTDRSTPIEPLDDVIDKLSDLLTEPSS
ncbi:hypothetical protein [Streptomyces meridianus]|uniref:Secreted protein n=1 Tax=Streptomyces meridianus TaxID=2938945 RepID=A0ABT0X2W8_9ACTN|nr:hypothetical protein [Streptomyces meridianus]MCM2576883.1 hypothetical protein [Streptomyces meridianus]